MRRVKIKIWGVFAILNGPIAAAGAAQALSEGRQVLPRTFVPSRYELRPDAPAGSSSELLAIAGEQNPDSVWQALAPHLAKGPLPMDQFERWNVISGIAAGSADPTRIGDIRHYGEQDMPADARRPVDAAVAAIKLNARVRAGALPDIDRWVASQTRRPKASGEASARGLAEAEGLVE